MARGGIAMVIGVAAMLLVRGPSLATDEWPVLELGSVSQGIELGQGPWGVDSSPDGIELWYGLLTEELDPVAVLFDDLVIEPSTTPQELLVSVADDPEAATIARALTDGAPEGMVIGLALGLEGGGGRGFAYGGGSVIPVESQAHIDYLRLVVPPFDFGKSTFPDGIHGYLVVTRDGAEAVFSALGRAPRGDASCSGAVDSIDALIALQFDAGLLLTSPCAKAGDVIPNGRLDSRDAQLILQYVAGLLDEL